MDERDKKTGDKTIGKGKSVFIVAEGGCNFDTLDEAIDLIVAIINSEISY